MVRILAFLLCLTFLFLVFSCFISGCNQDSPDTTDVSAGLLRYRRATEPDTPDDIDDPDDPPGDWMTTGERLPQYPTIPFDPVTGDLQLPYGPWETPQDCIRAYSVKCGYCYAWCDAYGSLGCSEDCDDACVPAIQLCIDSQ